MKKLIGIVILAAFISAPALANLTVGVTETFDGGLGDWNTFGLVTLNATGGPGAPPDAYVTLGGAGNNNSAISTGLATGGAGNFTLSLDYRFPGYDAFPGDPSDVVSIGVDVFGPGDVLAFSWSSDLDLQQSWSSDSVVMALGDEFYTFYITHVESTDPRIVLSTFDVDNILIARGGVLGGNVIPAPGALLLGSMGMGLVGWLRRRRAL